MSERINEMKQAESLTLSQFLLGSLYERLSDLLPPIEVLPSLAVKMIKVLNP